MAIGFELLHEVGNGRENNVQPASDDALHPLIALLHSIDLKFFEVWRAPGSTSSTKTLRVALI